MGNAIAAIVIAADAMVAAWLMVPARSTDPLARVEICGYLTAARGDRVPGIQWVWQDVPTDHALDFRDGELFGTARDVISGSAVSCFYRR